MANIGQKGGIYHIRFRFQGEEYKKSLKTRNKGAADAAQHVVEVTLHRLLTGQLIVPDNTDVADFILRGGVLREPIKPQSKPISAPSFRELADQYAKSQLHLLAPSYH